MTIDEGPYPSPTSSTTSVGPFPRNKHPRAESEGAGRAPRRDVGGGGCGRRGRRTVKERSQHEGTTAAQAKAIYEVYTPIDNGTVKEVPVGTVV